MYTKLNRLLVLAIATLFTLTAAACAPEGGDSEDLKGVDESVTTENALTGSLAVGSTLKTTANLNLRTGSSTSKSIIRTMPNGSTVTVCAGASSG